MSPHHGSPWRKPDHLAFLLMLPAMVLLALSLLFPHPWLSWLFLLATALAWFAALLFDLTEHRQEGHP